MCRKCVFTPLLDEFTQRLKNKMLALAVHCPPGHKSRPDHEVEVEGLQMVVNGLGCLIRGGPEDVAAVLLESRTYLLTLKAAIASIDEAMDLPDILPVERANTKDLN